MNGTFRHANTDERDGTGPHIYETLFPGYIVCHVLYVRDPRDVLFWLPFWKSDGPCYLDATESCVRSNDKRGARDKLLRSWFQLENSSYFGQ